MAFGAARAARAWPFAAALCIMLCACDRLMSSFPEATYQLSSGCRLPKWLDLPKDVHRVNVNVSADAYVDRIVFKIFDRQGEKVASKAAIRESRFPVEVTGPDNIRRSYEMVTADDVSDTFVIEYKTGGVYFCMVDDPSILNSPRSK